MATYLTPGVYYERVDATAPAISAIRTDIAGFVGIALRGPIDTAVSVQSWRQFQAHFGAFTGSGFLAYTVRAFFENGGRRCWVVRVASRDPNGGAMAAGISLQGPAGTDIWRIAASSPGVWGNDLSVLLQETHRAQTATDPNGSAPNASAVSSTSGFMRGTLVRLSQGSAPQAWKVVSDIDPIEGRLIWLQEKPELRLPYDSPVEGFDPDQPILIESVEYTLIIRELGIPLAIYEGLSLIPEHDHYGPGILAPLVISKDVQAQQTLPPIPLPITIEELRTFPLQVVEPLHLPLTKSQMALLPPVSLAKSLIVAANTGTTIITLDNRLGLSENDTLRIGVAPDAEFATIKLIPNRILGATPDAGNVILTNALSLNHAPGTFVWRQTSLDATIQLDGGADGLTLLTAYDFIGEDISPLDIDELKEQKRRGIRALELVDEVAIVAVPDIQIIPVSLPEKAPRPPCIPDPCLPQESIPPATPRTPADVELPPVFSENDIYSVQAALVQHCEDRRDRIALLDGPFATAQDNELGITAIRAWRSRFDSKYAALYYPWLRVVDPLHSPTAITRDIPPCGHVAGQYARSDFAVGVHKAPANSPLAWIQDVTFIVNDAVHGVLNPLGINVIRVLPGRGIRIFGARTISSDSDWRYVNVRRLMMMIEKAIDLSTQWATFEPNDTFTRAKIRLSLTSFLVALWQQGALMGSTTKEAFFVKCDDGNNPPGERANGRLLAEIGVAPSKPFEFIIVRVGSTNNEFEISELPMKAGGR